MVMLASGVAELISLGAVLPFLAMLSAPERLWQQPLVQVLAGRLGFMQASELLLPATLVFAVAAVLVGVAAYVSGDTEPPPPATQASIQPTVKESVEPAPEPETPAPAPRIEAPLVPPSHEPVTPEPKEEDDILVDDEEPPPRKTKSTADKKRSAKLVEEADKVLDQARKALFEQDYTKALKLADKSLLLHRSAAGYQLLGTAACKVGNKKVAKRAFRNLDGVRRSDLAKVCSFRGIELE